MSGPGLIAVWVGVVVDETVLHAEACDRPKLAEVDASRATGGLSAACLRMNLIAWGLTDRQRGAA